MIVTFIAGVFFGLALFAMGAVCFWYYAWNHDAD
jgi:hypothetical protein